MLDYLHNRLKVVERDLDRKVDAPTFPVYDPTNLPQDAVNGQIALGTDGSFNWCIADVWHTQAGVLSTLGNIPQDAVEGQIVVGTNNSLNWYVNGLWYGGAGALVAGNPPQDAVENQIALSTISPIWYTNGSWYGFDSIISGGGSGTIYITHIHQCVEVYNDGGLIHYTGRDLSQVSDLAASDGVAVKWSAPSFANFNTVYSAIWDNFGIKTYDVYEWQFTFADPPFWFIAKNPIKIIARVRGTNPATTYKLTFAPDPITSTNTSMIMLNGGTTEPTPSLDTAVGLIYDTQTWTGTTDYVDLTWMFQFIPDSIAAPTSMFYGWYPSGSGDIFLDKITMIWPA
jgi:hypothetical protein